MLKWITVTISVLAVILLIGCSKNDNMMNTSEQSLFTITPNDNETTVRLDKKIEVSFAKPMDKTVFEKDFHLISKNSMADSLCPMGMNMQHGDMNMAMMDTMKMNHLGNVHGTHGTFSWNSDNTKCTFQPDSMLTPNTIYMVSFGNNAMNMMQNGMNSMMENGGMMGGTMYNGMMIMHFTTMDTTSGSGSGHNGHH